MDEPVPSRAVRAVYSNYQRPPPPPPKLDSRGLASLTLIFLPFRSVSFGVCIALEASSALAISMKPKPFDWPENLSVITATLLTWPNSQAQTKEQSELYTANICL